MRVVLDLEANALENPTQIWVIVCKDIDSGQYHIFRNITSNEEEKIKFIKFIEQCTLVIGHNVLGYDFPVLNSLVGLELGRLLQQCCDTFIISKLADYSRKLGHSIASYGDEFGQEKIDFTDFSKYSLEMETYCIRDVDICHKIYLKYKKFISDCSEAIKLEQDFTSVVQALETNGFAFNEPKAKKLLEKVTVDLSVLDKEIEDAFPPRLSLLRVIEPRITKHGTLNKADFRWVKDGDLSMFGGGPFCRCEWRSFNPSSHTQIVETLHGAGWVPTDRTDTHKDTERELRQLQHSKNRTAEVDLKINSLILKLERLGKYGWKVNEKNLSTLPPSAPAPARILAKRILLESRRRTLTEWLGLSTGPADLRRIHGSFLGCGAWTHRMAHQKPNTANIPNDTKQDGSVKLLGKELRSLWCAPKKRLLVGVDAEGIQLRIFAHLINDPEFTEALVNGRKEDGTDPHSLNGRILGRVCKSRDAAKRFIYALLLGAGLGKLAEILECSQGETETALDRLTERYRGFDYLKREVIPSDAKRGFFIGLDGRRVPIPGATVGERRHLAMSGYLQCGEAVVMKKATLKWHYLLKNDNALLVNFVHDEWQTECPNNMEVALRIAKMQADSLREVGEELKLKCPLAGSYWNEKKKDYTIGTNWSVTH